MAAHLPCDGCGGSTVSKRRRLRRKRLWNRVVASKILPRHELLAIRGLPTCAPLQPTARKESIFLNDLIFPEERADRSEMDLTAQVLVELSASPVQSHVVPCTLQRSAGSQVEKRPSVDIGVMTMSYSELVAAPAERAAELAAERAAQQVTSDFEILIKQLKVENAAYRNRAEQAEAFAVEVKAMVQHLRGSAMPGPASKAPARATPNLAKFSVGDRVMVIDDGHLQERGYRTPEEVVGKTGTVARMYGNNLVGVTMDADRVKGSLSCFGMAQLRGMAI